ncbi:MAG: hypothetical protein Kow0092_36060 [Deferrisomatales bacterium]
MNASLTWAVAALTAGLLASGCAEKAPSQTAQKETPPPAAAASAAPEAPPAVPAPPLPSNYTGTVVETMDSGGYTYVRVDTGTKEVWAATRQFPVAVGDRVTFPVSVPMTNFRSKTLDRTFDTIYFVQAIRPEGQAAEDAAAPAPQGHPGGPVAQASAPVDFSGLTPPEGGQTVGALLGDPARFADREIRVRGKVVKFLSGIMGKNWIHVQDGTGEAGANDLTVTTQAVAQVGDTVLVEGKAAADRDFGYGYKYAFIVEDARVTVE